LFDIKIRVLVATIGVVSGPQRFLILARTVSILGDFAAPVALSFAVLALTPGRAAVTSVALVLSTAAAPQLLFLAAGGWERIAGRRLLLAKTAMIHNARLISGSACGTTPRFVSGRVDTGRRGE
jgi:hypothetical protein